MFIGRGREESRSRGKGKWRGKEKREVERDEEDGKREKRTWNKKEKSAGGKEKDKEGSKDRRRGGAEGGGRMQGQYKAYNGQRVAVGRTGVTWTSSHPCTVKTWLRSLFIVPSGLN